MTIPDDPDIFTQMIDDGEMPTEMQEELERYFTHISEDELSSDDLLDILATHNHERYECAYCYFLKGEKYFLTVEILVNNHSEKFTTEVLDKAFEVMESNYSYTPSTAEWVSGESDKPERLHVELALLPVSRQSQLRNAAKFFGFVEAAELYEELELNSEESFFWTLQKVAKHPEVTEEIFHEWLEYGHEARVGDGRVEAEGLHVEELLECTICQKHLADAWNANH